MCDDSESVAREVVVVRKEESDAEQCSITVRFADTFVLPVEYTCRTVPSSEAASRITPYSHNGISTSSAPEVGSVNTVGVVRGMVAIRSRVSSRRYPMLESWSSAWSRRQQHLVAETAAMPGTKPKTEDAPHSLPDNRQRGRADNRRALWVVVVVEEEDWSTAVLADSATSSSQILQPAGVTIIVVKDLQPHSRAYASSGAAGALQARKQSQTIGRRHKVGLRDDVRRLRVGRERGGRGEKRRERRRTVFDHCPVVRIGHPIADRMSSSTLGTVTTVLER
ncbi:hypothetical protein BDZ89DRAFT_1245138 [Hymenopellis radicata]|nr:hypothetical protein BDZ89DRAFT_1245138 [Hymenopellis radicata]